MLLLYIYASVAGLGLLSLPSYGAWYRANHRFEYGNYGGGEIVKVGEQVINRDGELDWWDVNWGGNKKKSIYDLAESSYPVSLAISIVLWPLLIAYLITKHTYLISSKVLALPGKAFVARSLNKKQNDSFMLEANKEVEKLCMEMK